MTNKKRVRSRHALHQKYCKKIGGGKEMASYLQKPVSHQGFDTVLKKSYQRTDIASLREAQLFLLFNFS